MKRPQMTPPQRALYNSLTWLSHLGNHGMTVDHAYVLRSARALHRKGYARLTTTPEGRHVLYLKETK